MPTRKKPWSVPPTADRATDEGRAPILAAQHVAGSATGGTDGGTDGAAMTTEVRRAKVAQLVTWGYQATQIARTLNIPYTTARKDVDAIRVQFQKDALPSLQKRLGESIAVYRTVQQLAIEAHYNASADSPNKVAALMAVIAAREHIDLLEGTSAPEKINTAALAEVQQLLMSVLGRLGGQALQIEFLKELQRSSRAGMNQLLTSGQTAETVESDESDFSDTDDTDG